MSSTSLTVLGQLGPFVRVSVGTSMVSPPRGGRPQRGGASGNSFYLAKLGGVWVVVVRAAAWIS
jgi:hypothetical protein